MEFSSILFWAFDHEYLQKYKRSATLLRNKFKSNTYKSTNDRLHKRSNTYKSTTFLGHSPKKQLFLVKKCSWQFSGSLLK